ncbi:hypothetical protein DFH06DRAFT_1153306 [Mycena polygramma]|nr:hypothetical protein DFH06DRAFT_1153306 [Mycena polygramma]
MFSLFSLIVLFLATVTASPMGFVTSFANLTVLASNTVRIVDTNGHSLNVDLGYPQGPEYTPVNGSPSLPTTAATNEDWILIPWDNNTFKIQSAAFPDMLISYASMGAPATIPSHSQLILRGNANAALFSLRTLSGGTTVNIWATSIVVAATGKVVTSWTTTLTDTTTPVTVTDLQAGSTRQTYTIPVIGSV